MKRDLSIFFQVLSLYCALTVSTSSRECPPAEFLRPCACKLGQLYEKEFGHFYGSSIECSNVLNNGLLEDIFGNSGFSFHSLTITDSAVEYIPKSIFQANRFYRIHIRNSLFTALFDDNPTSNFLKMVVENTTIRQGFEWNVLYGFYLTYLELRNNGITKLSRSFALGLNKDIREIWIFEPFLTSLSEDFLISFQRLEIIVIRNSNLRWLKKIKFPRSLRVCDFKDNRIEILPDGLFDGADSLQAVNFQGNRIKILPNGLFDGLDSPMLVMFTDNKLITVQEGAFAKAKNKLIDVRNNPLVCDCSMKWLVKAKTVDIQGECVGPTKMRGKHLHDFDESDFAYCK